MHLYTVLGIARDADDETIRSAYRILARRHHPDRGAGSSAEKFRKVNEACKTLLWQEDAGVLGRFSSPPRTMLPAANAARGSVNRSFPKWLCLSTSICS